MLVILDNGHGVDTAGKCSPVWGDGRQLKEYEFNRDIVGRIAYRCKMNGIPFHVLVTEAKDISLKERVKRVNELCHKHLGCWFISVHANAAAKPNTASGWSVWTSKGRTTRDKYADIFWEEAYKELAQTFSIRKEQSDGDKDYESNFYVLKNTICPAVMSENLFMDNENDCRFLMSEEGRERIADIHFRAIKRIAQQYYGYK